MNIYKISITLLTALLIAITLFLLSFDLVFNNLFGKISAIVGYYILNLFLCLSVKDDNPANDFILYVLIACNFILCLTSHVLLSFPALIFAMIAAVVFKRRIILTFCSIAAVVIAFFLLLMNQFFSSMRLSADYERTRIPNDTDESIVVVYTDQGMLGGRYKYYIEKQIIGNVAAYTDKVVWNNHTGHDPVWIDEDTFELDGATYKRGFLKWKEVKE